MFDIDLDADAAPANVIRDTWTVDSGRPFRIHLFEGDLTQTAAEAICTSTNGRLSLTAGSGGDVRARGGWAIKRECEAILAHHQRETQQSELPPGTAWATTAGSLSARMVIHCVASDSSHRSSPEIIRGCVGSALRIASEAGCRSIAMPVFASGHAAFRFDEAAAAMLDVICKGDHELDEIFVVALSPERIEELRCVVMAFETCSF